MLTSSGPTPPDRQARDPRLRIASRFNELRFAETRVFRQCSLGFAYPFGCILTETRTVFLLITGRNGSCCMRVIAQGHSADRKTSRAQGTQVLTPCAVGAGIAGTDWAFRSIALMSRCSRRWSVLKC